MRRIFIDVGGFRRTSTLAARDPIFGFDVVCLFEPVSICALGILKRMSSPRLTVLEKALADRVGSHLLHHAGSLAGSMSADAYAFGDSIGTIMIETVDAAKFLNAHISRVDFVRVKINFEGTEILIIESLRSADLLWALAGLLIVFGNEKIESLSGRSDVCRAALSSEGIRFYEPPEAQYVWV